MGTGSWEKGSKKDRYAQNLSGNHAEQAKQGKALPVMWLCPHGGDMFPANPLHDIFQKDDRAAGILLRQSIVHTGDRRYEHGPGKF